MNLKTFLALMQRDTVVAIRDLISFLVRTLVQPMFLLFIFGNVMMRMSLVTGGFKEILVPGVTALTMLFAGMQAVTLPLVLDLGYTKEIEDRLLSPIGVRYLALEKIVMGTLHSIFSGLLVIPLAKVMLHGGVSLSWHQWEFTLFLALLIGLVSSALGLTLGTYIKPEKIGLMFSLIIAPLIFFGCTYYPWEALYRIPWMQRLVLINPLVYMAEALRSAITPSVPHMSLRWILSGLVVSLILFTWLGMKGFRSRVID
ncbi:MAG: ABC transporter permease [Acidobacteriia bacterium]|nr:ABC transporter permease [Terriglobia bacterium]